VESSIICTSKLQTLWFRFGRRMTLSRKLELWTTFYHFFLEMKLAMQCCYQTINITCYHHHIYLSQIRIPILSGSETSKRNNHPNLSIFSWSLVRKPFFRIPQYIASFHLICRIRAYESSYVWELMHVCNVMITSTCQFYRSK